jgi:hypothetical protein
MGYSIDFAAVRAYLSGYQGLSRQGRIRLFVDIDFLLRQQADLFRNDPAYRIAPDRFQFDMTVTDPGNGSRHQFLFVVDDRAAAMGVLRLVYADGNRIL